MNIIRFFILSVALLLFSATARAESWTETRCIHRAEVGTIYVVINERKLYHVTDSLGGCRVLMDVYNVAVGREGMAEGSLGARTITNMVEWPDWHPPKEMIEREALKGHFLPAVMKGGEENPLGSRAIYLGNSLYRIHGTNAPKSIGTAASSGCIRMLNEDVEVLYDEVALGDTVVVIRSWDGGGRTATIQSIY